MANNLKECLEERIEANTLYPECRVCRAVFYIWDTADTVAAAFCAELNKKKKGHARPIAAENPEKAALRLNMEWNKCQDKIISCEISCQKGLYVLVIGSGELPEIADRIVLPASGCVEYARVVEDMDWNCTGQGNVPASLTEWRIRRHDVGAAAVLLMHAAYSEKLISSEGSLQRDCVFGLKFREYSAVKEAICRHFQEILDRKMKRSENFSHVGEFLYVNENVQKMMNACVKAEGLPFVGYEKLRVELSNQYGRSWNQKILAVFAEKYRRVQTNWSNKKVLAVFQGKDAASALPNVEVLRIRTREHLVRLGSQIVEQKNASILESLHRNFSFDDLKYHLPLELETLSRDNRRQAAEAEGNLKKVLDEGFAFKTLTIDDIMEELRKYYDLWNLYIEKFAESTYLQCLAEFVKELSQREKGNYESLKKAKTVLSNFGGSLYLTHEETAEDAGVGELLFSQEDLEESIKRYTNYAEYHNGDGARLIGAVDKEYQGTEDNNVNERRHPQIHVIFNEALNGGDVEESTRFKWIKHAVDYAPKSVFWELKIYTLDYR